MKITLNGKPADFCGKTLFELCREQGYETDGSTVRIINGFQSSENSAVKDGDEIVIIKKGVFPDKEQLECMLSARHSTGVYQKLKKARVAVAGLGGMGSNTAMHLARLGVGCLHLVDFDVVEPSNLNRQMYSIKHLGMEKTLAMEQQIAEINPYIKVITHNLKITEENCLDIFKDDTIVCEAFDNPDSKAMLVNTLLAKRNDVTVVASSGMAGYYDSNLIKTKKITPSLFICGDMENGAKQTVGLMSPRVAICAGHQSNAVLRLIVGDNDEQ